jgi:hypothetical protein
MKTVIHTALANRRRRQAVLLSLGGIAVLLVGLFLNFQSGPNVLVLAYGALMAGTLLSWLGVGLADQWVRPPRAEVALGEAMKGAGPAFALYHWALPAEHVLVAPWGLVLFRVYNTDGAVEVRGERWRDARPFLRRLMTLGRQPVRNPQRALAYEAERLRGALVARDPALAEVPMQPVAVFTEPRAMLTVEAPNLPVLRLDALRDWLRAEAKRPALPPPARRALATALDAEAGERLGTARQAEARARSEAARQARAADQAATEARKKELARAERRRGRRPDSPE